MHIHFPWGLPRGSPADHPNEVVVDIFPLRAMGIRSWVLNRKTMLARCRNKAFSLILCSARVPQGPVLDGRLRTLGPKQVVARGSARACVPPKPFQHVLERLRGVQRRPTYKVPQILGRVPPDLGFRGPLEARSSVRGPKIDPPGAQGRVFDLRCASCGHVRRCKHC